MKTFIYQDEKSHKFWAVEQQVNEINLFTALGGGWVE